MHGSCEQEESASSIPGLTGNSMAPILSSSEAVVEALRPFS